KSLYSSSILEDFDHGQDLQASRRRYFLASVGDFAGLYLCDFDERSCYRGAGAGDYDCGCHDRYYFEGLPDWLLPDLSDGYLYVLRRPHRQYQVSDRHGIRWPGSPYFLFLVRFRKRAR